MVSERCRPTRRSYIASIGVLATLAGCSGGDDPADGVATTRRDTTARDTGESGETTGARAETTVDDGQETARPEEERSEPDPFDPQNPLAERYGTDEREAIFRDTPHGELRMLGAIPDGEGPFPAVVHVHGGAWRYGGPTTAPFEPLARAGVAVASVEYRLSGTTTYPDPARDVVAGVQWVRANARDWNVDADRVALLGDSAGAHLAALVAGAPDHPNFQPEGFDVDAGIAVDAVIPHYGIFDLTQRDACENRNTEQFFGEDCSSESVVAEASPITHVDGSYPPVLLFHGDTDQLIPVEQSRRYRDTLADAGVPVEYHEFDGVDHGYIDPNNEEMADTRRRANRLTMTYLAAEHWSDL